MAMQPKSVCHFTSFCHVTSPQELVSTLPFVWIAGHLHLWDGHATHVCPRAGTDFLFLDIAGRVPLRDGCAPQFQWPRYVCRTFMTQSELCWTFPEHSWRRKSCLEASVNQLRSCYKIKKHSCHAVSYQLEAHHNCLEATVSQLSSCGKLEKHACHAFSYRFEALQNTSWIFCIFVSIWKASQKLINVSLCCCLANKKHERV